MKPFDIFKDVYGVFWIIVELGKTRAMCRRVNSHADENSRVAKHQFQVFNLYTTPADVEIDAIVTIRNEVGTWRLIEVSLECGYVVAQLINSTIELTAELSDVSIIKYKLTKT